MNFEDTKHWVAIDCHCIAFDDTLFDLLDDYDIIDIEIFCAKQRFVIFI